MTRDAHRKNIIEGGANIEIMGYKPNQPKCSLRSRSSFYTNKPGITFKNKTSCCKNENILVSQGFTNTQIHNAYLFIN